MTKWSIFIDFVLNTESAVQTSWLVYFHLFLYTRLWRKIDPFVNLIAATRLHNKLCCYGDHLSSILRMSLWRVGGYCISILMRGRALFTMQCRPWRFNFLMLWSRWVSTGKSHHQGRGSVPWYLLVCACLCKGGCITMLTQVSLLQSMCCTVMAQF